MAVLLLAEIAGGALALDATAKAVTAAKSLGDVTVLVAGPAAAGQAASQAVAVEPVPLRFGQIVFGGNHVDAPPMTWAGIIQDASRESARVALPSMIAKRQQQLTAMATRSLVKRSWFSMVKTQIS